MNQASDMIVIQSLAIFRKKNFKNDNFLNGIKTKQDKIKNSNIVEKIWFVSVYPTNSRSIQDHFWANEGLGIRKFWPLPKCQRFLWTTPDFSRLSKKTPNRFMTSITEHNHPFYFAPDFHTKFLTRKVINQNSIDENSIDLWGHRYLYRITLPNQTWDFNLNVKNPKCFADATYGSHLR